MELPGDVPASPTIVDFDEEKALHTIAIESAVDEKSCISINHGSIKMLAHAEARSISSLSTSLEGDEEEGKIDLSAAIPEKEWAQPFRGLRKRILIVYRVLFSLVGVINIGILIAILLLQPRPEWLATITAANLVLGIIIRQDLVVNALFTIACSVPRAAPLWLRSRCAKIYHLGGIHSGAGFCATVWLFASTIQATIARVERRHDADSLAGIVISWLLCALCFFILVAAMPTFRKKYHNVFEKMHRFLGWTALALFWAKTVVSVHHTTPTGEDVGIALIKTPSFWMLGVATCSIASSWCYLRKVKVNAEPLSDHAIRLHFDYAIPVNGCFTRISQRPLLEWHSFATIAAPEQTSDGNGPGYSLVVSNAGDWTKECIRNPPSQIWVRGLPTCGVMRIAPLFNRAVFIATGSGIGPMLGHITHPKAPIRLIWSAPNPEKTFGKNIINTIRQSNPKAVIHDTKALGRPNLVQMGYNMAKEFGAEAVIIIANETVTKKVVYGLETRGILAYGAIWDS